ncbi:MAG: glycosyltransferase 87 family protein [Ktedonobacterales bacterium]
MRFRTSVAPQPSSKSAASLTEPRERTHSQLERRLLAAILVLSLLLQLLLAPFRGFFGDVQTYVQWAELFSAHPLKFYSLVGGTLSPYPPLTIYLFSAVEFVYIGLGHLLGFSNVQLMPPRYTPFAAQWFVAKLPAIAANVGSSWAIYRLARSATSARWALLAALVYALAPSMLLDGALWGQTDGVPVFFILLALLATRSQRPGWAGALLGLAIMVKPQPVIFVPILLFYILLTDGRRAVARASLAGLVTIVVVCSPFLLPPHVEMLDYYQDTIRSLGLVTSHAYNLWYLIDYEIRQTLVYHTPVIGSLTATPIGVILFAPVYLLALYLVWRRRSMASVYMAMSLAAIGFFDLTALQHERYMFQALAFLLLAAVYYDAFVLHYIIASITVFMNMLIVSLASRIPVGMNPPMNQFFMHHPGIALLTAGLNLVLLAGVIITSVAWSRGSSHPSLADFWSARTARRAPIQGLPQETAVHAPSRQRTG